MKTKTKTNKVERKRLKDQREALAKYEALKMMMKATFAHELKKSNFKENLYD